MVAGASAKLFSPSTMKLSRRSFLSSVSLAAVASATSHASSVSRTAKNSNNSFDPWIEVDKKALLQNVQTVSALAKSRPVIAVVKNNAYGLGLEYAGPILENSTSVVALAVVKTDECFTLLKAGVKKPIMLMALPNSEQDEFELVRNGVQLCVFDKDCRKRLESYASKMGTRIKVHAYIDTGMSRIGRRFNQAGPWLSELTASRSIEVVSTFTDLTEDNAYDLEQVDRLKKVVLQTPSLNCKLHAASSYHAFHAPNTHLDWIRPGMALFGGYPDEARESQGKLVPSCRLKARVVRVEQLQKGDSVSYGRKFIAEQPTWIATLPVGHTDGYPRQAVKGARVLIGNETYPVIGAVSASHTIVNLGDERKVNEGDTAIFLGPDHPDIHPNRVAEIAGVSVYDIYMHLNPLIPKFILE